MFVDYIDKFIGVSYYTKEQLDEMFRECVDLAKKHNVGIICAKSMIQKGDDYSWLKTK